MSLPAFFEKIPLSLTDRLGCCALHFLWQGAAIGAGLWLLLAFCRRGTAELRHALCGLALLLMAAAPVITWRRLPAPAPEARTVALPEAVTVTGSGDAGELLTLENAGPDPAGGAWTVRAHPPGTEPFSEPEPGAPGRADGPETALSSLWQRRLGGLWLAGAAVMGVWRLCGLGGTFRLIRRGERAAGELLDQVARMARNCGLRRVPAVRITGRLISPAVAGVLRPVLLLPAAAMAGLSPRELEFVLAHEFAHIRRQDFLLGLLQSLAETLLFFHPAVWWVSRRMSFEREQACDDAAMRVTGNRRAAAGALARLAELQLQHTAAMAPAAGGGQILARVRRLLDPARSPQPRRGQALVLAPALLTAAAVPLLLLVQRAESGTSGNSPPVPASPPEERADPENPPVSETPEVPAIPATPENPQPPEPGEPSGPSVPAAASPNGATGGPTAQAGAGTAQAPAPLMRGAITDRNGVVLAESVIRDMADTGRTGTAEIRQYPLGATASHVLGYVKPALSASQSPSASAGGGGMEEAELRMRALRGQSKATLEALSRLGGDQLIESAVATVREPDYGMDGSLNPLTGQWKRDKVEHDMLVSMGKDAADPKLAALKNLIAKEQAVLLAGVGNYQTSLALNIKNIESALEAVRQAGQDSGKSGDRQRAEKENAREARIRKTERELMAGIGALSEKRAEWSRLSGSALIGQALAGEGAEEAILQLAAQWRKGQADYESKACEGFAPEHPEMTALSAAVQQDGDLLMRWVESRRAALAVRITGLQNSLKFLNGARRRLREKSSAEETDLTGAAGMEKVLDGALRSVPPADGKSGPAAALTLDARIQRICENALRDAGAGRGAAVVQDVSNGDILAMASVPDFDPNQFVPFLPQARANWSRLNSDSTLPLANRALSGLPPGSTFKLVTALAAANEGQWNRRWQCSGTVSYGGRRFPCWTVSQHAPPHGLLGLEDALKSSCNCWFYQAGNAAGMAAIADAAGKVGIGLPAASGLDGGVNSSFMPSESWWAGRDQGPWTVSKTANVSIGQGEVLATPLQMAGVAAAVAADGKVWRQRMISKRLADGVWQSPAPELEHDLIAGGTPAEALAAIRQGMWRTVNDEAGATGGRARGSIVTIAGKTGTAAKWRSDPAKQADRGISGKTGGKTAPGSGGGGGEDGGDTGRIADHHSWFIGFAPFDKPRYAFAVVVANGSAGGTVSAPVARRIMESVTLMNEGKLTVDLSPLAAAKGNFERVESVEYRNPLPGQ